MLKYVLCAVVVTAAFGLAFHARHAEPRDSGSASLTIRGEQPRVTVAEVAGERRLTVSHLVSGSVSRARLLYDLPEAKNRVAATQTDCQRSLGAAGGEGYTTQVTLSGPVPAAATSVRLSVESEMGERVYVLPSQP